MNSQHYVEEIIEEGIPAISSGAETLDSILAKHPQHADELRPRLEAALWLHGIKNTLQPRPGYIASSRNYLESQIATMQPIGFWQRFFKRYSIHRWAFNIIGPTLVVILLALVINSTILSAKLAIPGDPLYSTKLFIEEVRLTIAQDPVHKTDLYIQFSRERTTEFVELVLEGDYENLPAAAQRLEAEIIASLHALNTIPAKDIDIENSMVANFADTLSNEVIMLDVLKNTSSPAGLPGIDLAIGAARSGLMALR